MAVRLLTLCTGRALTLEKLLVIISVRGSLVVKALGYKPEGRVLKTRWGEILNLPNPSGRTSPWGLLRCGRLCGLVVRVPGYRSGGPGFDSRALQKK
jgi:hypothetical protein